jgi:hypothetical protein
MVGRLTPASDPECVFDSRFTCKTRFLRVEPRGFEPLTSAVQRQISIDRHIPLSATQADK